MSPSDPSSPGPSPQGPSPQSHVPILECVREGFAFLVRDWRGILPIALIGAAVMTPFEVWSSAVTTRDNVVAMLGAALAMGVLQTPVFAAYFRRAVSRGAEPLALRLGRDEANLAAVTLAVAFLFVVIGLIALFVLAFAVAALASAAGIDVTALKGVPPVEAQQRIVASIGRDGQIVVVVLAAAFVGLMLWLSARLALSYPATVAEGRMQVFSTWRWTKGHAASVAACLLLVSLVAIALYIVVLQLPAQLASLVFGAAALTAPANPGFWIISFISAVAVLALIYAPYAAMLAYLYRGLKPTS